MDSCENCGEGAPVQCVACTAIDCQRIAELERENAELRQQVLARDRALRRIPLGTRELENVEWKEGRTAREAE